MMGRNHAATGILTGLLTMPLAPEHTAGKAGWVCMCAAAALLPDMDIPGSTASRAAGTPSMIAAALIGLLAGGHRRGTHDLILAPFAFAAITWIAGLHPLSLMVLLTFFSLIALRIAVPFLGGFLGSLGNLAGSAFLSYWLVIGHSHELIWLPLAVALGVFVHILGDWLTEEGIPIPIKWLNGDRRRISAGLFRVNSLTENLLVSPLLILAIGGTGWAITKVPL